jgi:diaminopimelate epimerase
VIAFSKYQGAGNDFVLMDFSRSVPPDDLSEFARRLCHRQLGIGADGLLLLLPSSVADYRMRIFNADGSEPSMCGNGIRCLVDFIQKHKNGAAEVLIETPSGVLRCRRIGEEISVNLGVPAVMHWPIELPQGMAFVVDTGVPHAVLFVDALDQIAVEEEGRKVRFHFEPHGVNVNFVFMKEGKIAIRTYERGVEGETLACGTGAAAAAFVAMKQHNLSAPIGVLKWSGVRKKSLPAVYKFSDEIWVTL